MNTTPTTPESARLLQASTQDVDDRQRPAHLQDTMPEDVFNWARDVCAGMGPVLDDALLKPGARLLVQAVVDLGSRLPSAQYLADAARASTVVDDGGAVARVPGAGTPLPSVLVEGAAGLQRDEVVAGAAVEGAAG